MISGVLVVDKPRGPTSFQVVAAVRRALGVRKVGHTGTLDPMATGVLPICVGRATKLAAFLTAADKTYLGTVRLGASTDTLDAEGTITGTDAPDRVAAVGAAGFAEALPAFIGSIRQRPPVFSAIKVDGRRLYERARAGEAVEAPERVVQIHALVLVSAEPPDFHVRVRCSKGTYVRSLARDIAASLGLRGHLIALRREACGPFTLDEAVPLAALIEAPDRGAEGLISMADALAFMPALQLDAQAADDVRHGRRRAFDRAAGAQPGLCRGLDAHTGRLIAILDVPADGSVARIVRVLDR